MLFMSSHHFKKILKKNWHTELIEMLVFNGNIWNILFVVAHWIMMVAQWLTVGCFFKISDNLRTLLNCLDDTQLANFCRILAVAISDLDIYENKSSCKKNQYLVLNKCKWMFGVSVFCKCKDLLKLSS